MPGDMPSTPIRRASARPGMAARLAITVAPFHVIPNSQARSMSAGTPSSQVVSRCTAPVSPRTTQPGPKGRVPAVQRRVTSET